MNAATYEVFSVTMRSEFYLDEADKPTLYEYIMTAEEWQQYIRAHRLSMWCPFTCAATFMSEELEALVCGHRPERYKRIDPNT